MSTKFFLFLSSQYCVRTLVILLLIPLLKAKSSNRMGKAGQMESIVENRSAGMKGFGGENGIGGYGMYLSGAGYELGGRFYWIRR